MRVKAALTLVLGGLLVGSALVWARQRPSPPPVAPAPSVFDDIARLAPPSKAPNEVPSQRPETQPVPVSVEGRILKVGGLAVDLEKPGEELTRLVLLFRRIHAEFRKNRADPGARAALLEAGTALGHLLGRRPELGVAYFRAALEEPHPDALRDLAPLLQRAPSPALHQELARVLRAGGPVMPQYLAAVGLPGSAEPEAVIALYRAWVRESDLPLRRRIIESLSAILAATSPADGGRRDVLEQFRERARSEADPARRVEAAGALIESQDGNLPEPDAALVRRLIAEEQDPNRKRQLEQLARRIKP